MRIGFFVNDIAGEVAGYTTTCLAVEALRRGHEVWYLGAGDFVYDPDESIRGHGRTVPRRKYESNEEFLDALRGGKARRERITVDDLDVLLLRADPSIEYKERPWAQNVGILFGQLAADRGVIVLNDPQGLARAMNKLYFQQFPAEIRPRTLITRCAADVKPFVDDLGGRAILKPLVGSGGENVFLVQRASSANLNQIIDAIARDGYVVVQEYLPAARKGDVRLFLLNGHPWQHDGKFAALARSRADGDIRSNMHVGGRAEKAVVDERALHIAEAVRPKLVRDGMFLVGLDIIGDKLMEVNVFSPGGLYSITRLTKVNFPRLALEAIERKLEYERLDSRTENAELAVL